MKYLTPDVKKKIIKSFFPKECSNEFYKSLIVALIKADEQKIFPCVEVEETELDKQIISLLDSAPTEDAKKALLNALSSNKSKDLPQFPCFCLSEKLNTDKRDQVVDFFIRGFNMKINQFDEFILEIKPDEFISCTREQFTKIIKDCFFTKFTKSEKGMTARNIDEAIESLITHIYNGCEKTNSTTKFDTLRDYWDGKEGRLKHLFEDYWHIEKDTPSIAYESLMLSLACKVLDPSFYAPHMWDISGDGGIGKGVFIRNLVNCFDPIDTEAGNNTFDTIVMNSFPDSEQEFHKKLSHKKPLIVFDEEMSLIKETAGVRSNESPFSLVKFKDWLGQNGSSGVGERQLYTENNYLKKWGGYIVIRNTNSPEYMVYSPNERRQITLALTVKGNSSGNESPIKPISFWKGEPDNFNPNCAEFYKQLWAEYLYKAEKLPRTNSGHLCWDFTKEQYYEIYGKKAEQASLSDNPANEGLIQYLSALDNVAHEYLFYNKQTGCLSWKNEFSANIFKDEVLSERNLFNVATYQTLEDGTIVHTLTPCGTYSLYTRYCRKHRLQPMNKNIFYTRIQKICTAYGFNCITLNVLYKRPRTQTQSRYAFYPLSLWK